ncbi:MAG: hypothetical protein HY914_02890 [Desulfomonile tiedjei]|nr:hypothetical protein [Desulfomonile tiedjei]
MSEQIRTYQTRLDLSSDQSAQLGRYAALYGRVERTLFASVIGGEPLAALKRKFLKRFGITARQFNAVAASIKGKIGSAREIRERMIESSEQRIRHAEKVLSRISDPSKRHQKNRRLATLKTRLANLKADQDAGRIRICFGSRKLFREQFALRENGFASFADWLAAWREARSSQIFVIGSRDETAGCQSCVATLAEDGSLTLRLRLPDALGVGRHLTISGVRVSHGHDAVAASVGRNLSENAAEWQPITYRFVRDCKGWRVFTEVWCPRLRVGYSRGRCR